MWCCLLIEGSHFYLEWVVTVSTYLVLDRKGKEGQKVDRDYVGEVDW